MRMRENWAMSADAEHLFILRLPEPEVNHVREAIKRDDLGERLQLEFNKDMRHATVKVDDKTLSAKLVDLPTVVECHKTIDNKTLYKTGNISQMLICTHDPPDTASISNIEELPTSQQKEYLKKFTYNHGITPPLKNVRRRRFKKMTTKKFVDSPEVEKEVKRLLREDCNAINVSWKVVTDEDKANDDSQSVASEGASRAVTPATTHDEDSFSSTPPARHYHGNSRPDDKQEELMRMFAEVSSSSGGEDEEEEDDEEEEEEIEVMETEQMRALNSAIQDLDNQIEEQKLKIQNTANTSLRGRFEVFLKELETERQFKIDELEKLEENS